MADFPPFRIPIVHRRPMTPHEVRTKTSFPLKTRDRLAREVLRGRLTIPVETIIGFWAPDEEHKPC